MHGQLNSERILIVEDEESVASLLERILRHAGYVETQSISDPRRALPVYREWNPDLVIMDMQMPHLNGISAMQQIRTRSDPDEFLPFLFITGDASGDARARALEAGAADFLAKPFESAEVVTRVRNLLTLRRVQRELSIELSRRDEDFLRLQIDLVDRLAMTVKLAVPSSSDPEQVGELSAHIARALLLPEDFIVQIRLAAQLHDIGMIGVSEDLLLTDRSLSLEEIDHIRDHASAGARVLGNSDLPLLQLAEEIALYHHEAWDGSGYTPGLKGESIPVAARIVSVADTFCAMTGRRSYQNSHSREDAIAWIEAQAGKRFDPDVVQAFISVCNMADLPVLPAPRARP